jgi:AcrR family transcriptional regulator
VNKKTVQRGVSKGEWLAASLEVLSERGVAGITIDGVAKTLGISKAGFYWHFKNRDDLLREMLAYWIHEVTLVVTANPQLIGLTPKNRLIKIAEMIIDYDLGRYDMPIRQWARTDAGAARVVRKVNRIRLDFLSTAFSELGFKGEELEMRARLFICYHALESSMFREVSRKRRRGLITKRVELLISK